MAALECVQFTYGSDNYGVLLHDAATGQTACVDAGDAQATISALSARGWTLSHLLITHHHGDHTAGVMKIKQATQCLVIGPEPVSQPIAGIDTQVGDGDQFVFAERQVEVLHTPGHTIDMINFHFPDDKLVFTGDTLFSMGCGRLFEGDAAMMLASINKLKALPADTTVYCAHEYTATNARFALNAANASSIKASGSLFMRTNTLPPLCPAYRTEFRKSCLAATFFPTSTASSRSSIIMSAPRVCAFLMNLGLSAGT